MTTLRTLGLCLASTLPLMAVESFESMKPGPFESADSVYGRVTTRKNDAVIITGKGRSGKNALHLTGGENKSVTLDFNKETKDTGSLDFHAERWTSRGNFTFRVEAEKKGVWSTIAQDDRIEVGAGCKSRIRAEIPAGTRALRFSCSSTGGMLIDDLTINRRGPMSIIASRTIRHVAPVLSRKAINPVLGLDVTTEGDQNPQTLGEVVVSLEGSTRPGDIERIDLIEDNGTNHPGKGNIIASSKPKDGWIMLKPAKTLTAGNNRFWFSINLKDTADIDGKIALTLGQVTIGGKNILTEKQAPAEQRIGTALRQQGDDGSHSYRIPGMVQTNKGSLIAVYDIRYKHCGDLPAAIDVGVSRSPDGGKHWEDMRIAMHCGTMGERYEKDGVGDPAVLVDRKTGRIWIAALWSHGNRAWNNSGPGITPEETGQLLLTHSDDDGKSWSGLQNITAMVKDPSWRLMFNGPGAGICMKDGTLVFPAQFRAADGGDTKGKPFSTILYSKDRGESWHIGTGAKIDTTEAQVAELDDGTLMLNCRDNHGGSRTVMVTKDMGKTWSPHPTDRGALPEPVCMASLLRWDHPKHGTLFAFSNPADTGARHNMTLKLSKDSGNSWPTKWHTLYDSRKGSGYSCLAAADQDHIGVLYEGECELYFMRIPLEECLRPQDGN